MRSCFPSARIAAAAVGLLFLVGCKESPTEPSAYWCRIGSSSSPVALQNATGSATIVRLRTYLDGALISDTGETLPSATVAVYAFVGDVSLGSHTLRIEVANQTSSPNNYSLPDLPVSLVKLTGFYSESTIAYVKLPGRTQSVATGESFEYQISFK